MKFWIKMVAGLFLGIIVGSYLGPDSIILEPMRVIGVVFIRVLNFLVFPLLFFSAMRSVAFLRQNRRLFIVLVKSLGYFLLLTAVGATIGIVLGDVLEPGLGDAIFLTAREGRMVFLLCVVLLPLSVVAFGASVFVQNRKRG